MRHLSSVVPVLLWLIALLAFTQLSGITSRPLPGGGQSWSLPVQTLVFIASLTLIPAILLMMTSFTRIVIVFGSLRNALGAPSAPPNQVSLGLALFLTPFIASPTIDKIYVDARQPFSEEKIPMQEALEEGTRPLREFILCQIRETDLGLFARSANTGLLQGPETVPMRILLPTYVTSELRTTFQIGFTTSISSLIIDLAIAGTLMTLGIMMVPPATIALPSKLTLFVLVDGQQLLVGLLVQGFYSQRGGVTPESVMMMGTEAIKVALVLTAPLLLAALATSLVISILQAATQTNEMALSSIPKIIVISIAIIIAGPWMLNLLLDYVHISFTNLPYIIGQPV